MEGHKWYPMSFVNDEESKFLILSYNSFQWVVLNVWPENIYEI